MVEEECATIVARNLLAEDLKSDVSESKALMAKPCLKVQKLR
jgi:hypothetical protein